MKFVSALIIFTTLFFAVVAQNVDEDAVSQAAEEVRSYYKPRPRPCPCKCFFGRKIRKAIKQCRKRRFFHRCSVQPCTVRYYSGKYCCDKVPISKSPTPSPTPTKSPIPPCPCICKYTKEATHDCLYKPHCKVIGCGYGRSKCCDH